jgi:hypothetical protein
MVSLMPRNCRNQPASAIQAAHRPPHAVAHTSTVPPALAGGVKT